MKKEDDPGVAWLWQNDQEYKDGVHPVVLNRITGVRQTQHETWFSLQVHLHEAATELEHASNQLRDLQLDDERSREQALLDQAERLTEDVVYHGEVLLLYHKRLALTDWAYDFLHAHDLTDHWNRYAATRRIVHEVNELIAAADKLMEGYQKLQAEDERFLADLELPAELVTDFTLTRNLFSVGLDDLAVFTAGRGLEGVLRAIARRRKLTYQVKGKAELLQDADFHDLSEAFSRIKLANGTTLIDKESRSLLEFARTVRNSTAHPGGKQQRRTARQIAEVMANAAQHVWTTCNGTRFAKTVSQVNSAYHRGAR